MKTITITDDAYKRVKKMKEGDESFSELFLRISSKKPPASVFLGILKKGSIEDDRKRLKKFREDFNKDAEARRHAMGSR